jgi:hypothetical protein
MYRSGTRVGWGRPMHDNGPSPEEYFDAVNGVTGTSPEKRLRLAVLLNAIADLRRGGHHPGAHEAVQWIRGEIEAVDASFSFLAICETLEIDPTYLMRGLLGTMVPSDDGATKLPRRQVRTQRLYGTARRYRRTITDDP